jgi:hypothetical protein
MDWVDLVRDGDRWWTVVKVVMNFGFRKMQVIS